MPVNPNLPLWVNLVTAVLDFIYAIGTSANNAAHNLLEKHCGCETCKKAKRGKYAK